MSIPNHRTASAMLTVFDKTGRTLADTEFEYELKNHKFLFGCNAFDINSYINIPDEADKKFFTSAHIDLPDADAKKFFKDRTDKWLDLFNFATLPFYWGRFELEEGKPDTEALKSTARFLKDHDVTIKGHPLCWHTACCDWLLKYDNKTILEKQLARIDREVAGFKGLIDKWDVINEVVIMPVFDKYDNAITRICNEYGQIGLVKKVFDEAYANNKDATLVLNDFNMSKAYEDLIERCLDAGVKISVIGLQSHQHQGYWGKEKILDVVERFSRFGLPLHFTENTILSGTPVPDYIEDLNDWQVDEWPSTPEYEEIQRNNMEEMYRTLFDCPQVHAITQWDFTDGAWLKAPAGITKVDNTLKPSYHMLKGLIKDEWSSKGKARTNSDGVVKIEGVKGKYVIKYKGEIAEFVVDDNVDSVKITF